MKERVFITLHGYKRPYGDDFHALQNNIDLPGKVVVFDYYDSTDKKLIDRKIGGQNIHDELDKYKDHPVTLIGYSVGAVAALAVAGEYDNIDQIYAITPAFKTRMMIYVAKGLAGPYYLVRSQVRKHKMGKAEYKAGKKSMSRGANEKYPITMTREINKFKLGIRNFVNNTEGKRIRVAFARGDEVIDKDKAVKFLNKHLSNNDLSIIDLDIPHRMVLEDDSPVYPDIDKGLKEG